VGAQARVIEPGSGEGVKTQLLLSALDAPAVYVPIDVSEEQLERTAARLREEHPGLEVLPLHGDYTGSLVLPESARATRRTLVFFPGSTIGNFEPADAVEFLARRAALAGPRGQLLLGADATADPHVLQRAYDDDEGVTAAFDLNLLAHVNRSADASFDLDAFEHRAVWNPVRWRVEMHLVSRVAQHVRVGGEIVAFARGEPIVTEHCYKHPPQVLEALLARAGWAVRRVYVGAPHPMRLLFCDVIPSRRR
jgi:dimethylhistidine N-methyltransferase